MTTIQKIAVILGMLGLSYSISANITHDGAYHIVKACIGEDNPSILWLISKKGW